MKSTETPPPYHHVVVIVLGDVGRSPRMQYHTLSLLENGFHVSLVGYSGEGLIPPLEAFYPSNQQESTEQQLHVFRFQPHAFPSFLRRGLLKPIYYILRAMSLLWILLYTLFFQVAQVDTPVQCVLVQNPPSIPLLYISLLFCKIQEYFTGRHVGLIIDWHNLGFSMFDVSPRHPIRRFAQTYEIFMAQRANIHFCVTQGMKQWLMDHAKIEKNHIFVLYDRPPDFFQPTSITDKHVLWTKFNTHFWETCPNLMKLYDIQSDDETLLTLHKSCAKEENSIVVRKDRPAILVSSTSWTADEDFGILLDALCQLDAKVDHDVQKISLFQHLLVIVTGKGPLKSMYLEKIEKLALKHVTIQTMWLEAADYPRLLGCSDLGVSLHTSTSGIDLPMKVVDMFGCQVPVCAMGFSCIHELVKDTVHGRIFTTSEELCKQLCELIFTVQGQELLKEYRGNISNMKRWRENWNDTVGAEILDMCRQDKVKVG